MSCLRSVMAHTQSRKTAAARNWSSTPPAQERCAPGKVAKMRAVSGTDLVAGWKHDTIHEKTLMHTTKTPQYNVFLKII